MRIGDGVKLIQGYWASCTNPKMLAQAKKDHRQHLEAIIKTGYTWGLDHQLPFEVSDYSRDDVQVIHSILFGKEKKSWRTQKKNTATR